MVNVPRKPHYWINPPKKAGIFNEKISDLSRRQLSLRFKVGGSWVMGS